MKLLIANWKAQLTFNQIQDWNRYFKQLLLEHTDVRDALRSNDITIVICPPFPFIQTVKDAFQDIPEILIGSQTVSSKTQGKYTGEVTAKALKEFASYAIVGHSERRRHFNLTDEEVGEQIARCTEEAIKPILCVRNEQDRIFDDVSIVAYEPVEAIGSGQNAEVNDVLEMKQRIQLPQDATFLYGGSVDATNANDYMETGEVDGFLVGTASLKAESFFGIARKMIVERKT